VKWPSASGDKAVRWLSREAACQNATNLLLRHPFVRSSLHACGALKISRIGTTGLQKSTHNLRDAARLSEVLE
jgi:hypothetical protein